MVNGDLELGDVDKIRKGAQSLLVHCARNVENDMNQVSPSIFMAPSILRDLSPGSFDPVLVSIGPLHKQDKNVQAFEKQKTTYLMKLMNRINSPRTEILESCMEKAYTFMNKIKACYVWTTTYDDAEIAEMMVMDACFILEYTLEVVETVKMKSYAGSMLQFRTVMYDLVLLENQIPFFFLHEIFQCTIVKFASSQISLMYLMRLVLTFNKIVDSHIVTSNVSIDTPHHILSLLHECYKPQDNIIPKNSVTPMIPSASGLDMRGVNFKPNQDPTWVMEMDVKLYKFLRFFGCWNKPTLRMPVLLVGDNTEMILRNLIAYEQSFQIRSHITSYAYAMDMLVNTQEDVAKLVDSKVLINYMGTNEEAANMINNVNKNVTPSHFFYVEEWETLNMHCNAYWPKHIAKMRSTYFSSPWSLIALIAGILLFSLTVVQTIFTVKPLGSNK